MVVAIIDTSETNQKAYAHILSRIGDVKVKPFTSPDAALVWCGKQEHDLVILDYRMGATEGSMDGLEFVKAYNKAHGETQTPLVMIPGEKDREIRHRALELGASDFLNKPADPVEFLSRVKNLLALRESRKKLESYAASLAADVRAATKEIADREHETITRLMRAMEYRDNDTGMHVMRMGQYAMTLGRALELG